MADAAPHRIVPPAHRRWLRLARWTAVLVLASGLVAASLAPLGRWLVRDDAPQPADAVVVLFTDIEVIPRLVEAARLYRRGFVGRVVINGDRKTQALRNLERQGFQPAALWSEDYIRMLETMGVARADVIAIAAEDVFDTISEAAAVGKALVDLGIRRAIVTTSKSHTRRAGHIWQRLLGRQLQLSVVAAHDDPYDPEGWWHHRRQIRWVLAELGAWVFYGGQVLIELFAPASGETPRAYS